MISKCWTPFCNHHLVQHRAFQNHLCNTLGDHQWFHLHGCQYYHFFPVSSESCCHTSNTYLHYSWISQGYQLAHQWITMWHLSLPLHIIWGILTHNHIYILTWWSQVTEIHSQKQYLWHVLFYQWQFNQDWLIYLIPYIGQSLYPHFSQVRLGVKFPNCPPTCPRGQHKSSNKGW